MKVKLLDQVNTATVLELTLSHRHCYVLMLKSAEQYTRLRTGWTTSPLTLRNARTLASLPSYTLRSN